MMNNNLDAALEATESNMTGAAGNQGAEILTIKVKNQVSGNKTTLDVYPTNQLSQVLDATAEEIGINKKMLQTGGGKKTIFINEISGQSTADASITIKEFGITQDNVLAILPDGCVAAVRS